MTAPAWAPATADVGALLHARTLDNNGNELGDFTPATRPTGTNVTSLIAQAVDDVVDAVGQDVPADLQDNAAKVAAVGAAMLVEMSYYPEQVGTGRSSYPQLKTMYDDRLKRLVTSVEAEGGPTPTPLDYMVPQGAFGGPPIPLTWWTPF